MKACQRLEVSGRRGRGRKTWRECVAEDMKVLGLEECDVQDRLKWRRGYWGNRLTHASMETTDVKPLIIFINTMRDGSW